jgi:hypothetical protein
LAGRAQKSFDAARPFARTAAKVRAPIRRWMNVHKLLMGISVAWGLGSLAAGAWCAVKYLGSWSAEADAEEVERAQMRSTSWPTNY